MYNLTSPRVFWQILSERGPFYMKRRWNSTSPWVFWKIISEKGAA
jgi:hypothetical protein